MTKFCCLFFWEQKASLPIIRKTKKGNKILDHFLLDFSKDRVYPSNSKYWASSTLKFETDWNWIMMVIDKFIAEGTDGVKPNYSEMLNHLSGFNPVHDLLGIVRACAQKIKSYHPEVVEEFNKLTE